MASSSSNLNTNNNINNGLNSFNHFSFSTQPFMTTSSFSDLLASPLDENENNNNNNNLRNDYGVPKFKSTPPPSLPLSPPLVSPSSYFSVPPGLSPAELLDSPVLLNSNNVGFFYSIYFSLFYVCFLCVFFLDKKSFELYILHHHVLMFKTKTMSLVLDQTTSLNMFFSA